MAQAAWTVVENAVPTTVVRESTDIFAALFAAELGSATKSISIGETDAANAALGDPIPEQQKQDDPPAPNALVTAAALSVTAPAIVLTPEPITVAAESVSHPGDANELSALVTHSNPTETPRAASSGPGGTPISSTMGGTLRPTPVCDDTLADQDFASDPQPEQGEIPPQIAVDSSGTHGDLNVEAIPQQKVPEPVCL